MTANSSRVRLGLALVGHLCVTGLVWKDIEKRTSGELRGSKALWRVLTAMNAGNSLVYLVVGRRR